MFDDYKECYLTISPNVQGNSERLFSCGRGFWTDDPSKAKEYRRTDAYRIASRPNCAAKVMYTTDMELYQQDPVAYELETAQPFNWK